MDVVGLLTQMIFKSILVILPFTIAWLAFRRLVMSRSVNAWLYGLCGLFAATTGAGLLPWALGLAGAPWLLFIFAAFSPALWLGIVLICDAQRVSRYTVEDEEAPLPTFQSMRNRRDANSPPLVLENPDWPGAPIPVFRHSRPANDHAPGSALSAAATKRTLLSIAREMRGKDSSDDRRPKLLPPPAASELTQLPFLKDAATT